jgi:hypothetical protein
MVAIFDQKRKKTSAVIFSFLVIITMDPYSDPDSLEMLDPYPDPDSMSPNPQHWFTKGCTLV